jgi:transposase-like protein
MGAAAQSEAADAFRGNGKMTSQDEELRRLRRKLAVVTEERDILKKAYWYTEIRSSF